MKCRHCRVDIQQLKDADTHTVVWVHVGPDGPYQICKVTRIAEPDTGGPYHTRIHPSEWAG